MSGLWRPSDFRRATTPGFLWLGDCGECQLRLESRFFFQSMKHLESEEMMLAESFPMKLHFLIYMCCLVKIVSVGFDCGLREPPVSEENQLTSLKGLGCLKSQLPQPTSSGGFHQIDFRGVRQDISSFKPSFYFLPFDDQLKSTRF